MNEPAGRYISIYGILIKRTDFGEGNDLLTIIDRDKGLYDIASFGSGREKSSRREALLVTNLISGICSRKEDESLPSLKEASIEKSFDKLTSDYHCLSYVFLIFEILSNILRKEQKFQLFQLFLETLERINDKKEAEKYSFYFITKFLKNEGLLPSFQTLHDYSLFLDDLDAAGFRAGNGTIRLINDIDKSPGLEFLDAKKLSRSVVENFISLVDIIMKTNYRIELKSLSMIFSY